MTAHPGHALRLNARELLRVPGSEKSVALDLPARELGIDDERITGAVAIDATAVSSIDGVAVHGTITVPWSAPCRRCLADVSGVATIELDELYQDDVRDDAYPIEGDQIDLAPAAREYVLLELPDSPLCRDDCAGICPVCGIDRNDDSCSCDTSVRDERWAALDDLRLDE